MEKKDYEKPMLQVVLLQHATHLLSGSPNASLPNSTPPEDAEWD